MRKIAIIIAALLVSGGAVAATLPNQVTPTETLAQPQEQPNVVEPVPAPEPVTSEPTTEADPQPYIPNDSTPVELPAAPPPPISQPKPFQPTVVTDEMGTKVTQTAPNAVKVDSCYDGKGKAISCP